MITIGAAIGGAAGAEGRPAGPGAGARAAGRLVSMQGRLDGWWSRDGENWSQIGFTIGGGASGVFQYSSQEWTRTVVDSKVHRLLQML